MELETHRRSVASIHFGKKLSGATYVVRPRAEDVLPELWNTLCRAEVAAQPDPSWNLLKLHTDQVAITFLSYPEFDAEPHPVLAEATKINLNTGSVSRTDYRQRSNPPIQHRKETFLQPHDPRIHLFAALTRREEEAGLYRDPSRIGLRVPWLTLLQRLGLEYEDHTLVSARIPPADSVSIVPGQAEVARHRTAIRRYDLSKPVKQILERGLLRKTDSFFDYPAFPVRSSACTVFRSRYRWCMLDWSQCPAVERIAGKVSGAWLFQGTRVPVRALFENLEGGATVDEFLEWFPGVTRAQVEAVLEHAQRSLVET